MGTSNSQRINCSYCISSKSDPKKIFWTLDAANNECISLNEDKSKNLEPYKCPHSFGFHLRSVKEVKPIFIKVPTDKEKEIKKLNNIEYETTLMVKNSVGDVFCKNCKSQLFHIDRIHQKCPNCKRKIVVSQK